MAGYPNLNQIKDSGTRDCVKSLWDLANRLQQQITALQQAALVAPYNAGGLPIANVGRPTKDSDAVPVSYLREVVSAQQGIGATGTIDTTAAQTIEVKGGVVTKIE